MGGLFRRARRAHAIVFLCIVLAFGLAWPVRAEAPAFAGYPVISVFLNGAPVPAPVPAINLGGTAMIPLRAFAEALGLQVGWDGSRSAVTLSGPTGEGVRSLQEQLARLERRVQDLEVQAQRAREELTAQKAALERAQQTGVNVSAIFEGAKPSIVGLLVKTAAGRYAAGTGVVSWRAADGREAHITTNRHVLADYQEITAVLSDGRVLPGTFWVQDGDLDLAMIRIEGEALPAPLAVGKPAAVRVGDPVVAIGNPLGFRNSVSLGVLSGRGRFVDNTGYEYLQFDAAVSPGNSGGPLLDRDGRWIGVVTVKRSGAAVEGLSFAYTVDAIRTVIGINNRPDPSRSYLGGIFSESPAVSLGAVSTAGLTLILPDFNGPLVRAGLAQFDEIVAVNDQRMAALADLRQVVDTVLPYTRVMVKYRRGGREYEAPVVTGAVKHWETKPVLLQYQTFPDFRLEDWQGAF